MNILSLFDGKSGAMAALKQAGIKITSYYASEIDKYAEAVSKYHYPEIIRLGDVTKVGFMDLPKIDLLVAGFPCTPKGTKVKTLSGYKNIEDITTSDYVLTHNNEYKKVVITMSKLANHINIVKSQGCYNLKLTDEHPLYVCRDSKFEWVECKDLKTTDYLTYNINKLALNSHNLNEIECWLLGRYIADGTIESKRSRLYFSIGKKKAEEFKSKISSYKHFICHLERNCHEIYINDNRLIELATTCGSGALNKIIPQFIIDLPYNLLKQVWDGYISGDGHFDTKVNRQMFTTVSENLFLGLQDIIIKLFNKIPSCLVRVDKRKVTFNDTYNGQFYATQKDSFVKDDKLCVKVKGLERVELDIEVFNFEVEDDNSYTLNNVIVHNCQAFSFAGKQLNFEDPRGKLFFEVVRLIHELKPKYFLLENVQMKKDILNKINELVGVEPVLINSSLLSAQNRKRNYWVAKLNRNGIYEKVAISQPEDKGILLKDIIEDAQTEKDKSYCIDANYAKGANFEQYQNKSRRQLVVTGGAMRGRYLDENGKRLDSTIDSQVGLTEQRIEVREDGKSNCLTSVQKDSLCIQVGEAKINGYTQIKRVYSLAGKPPTLTAAQGGNQEPKISENNITWRKLTPIECERLQTYEDNFTAKGIINNKIVDISNSQRYKMLGNGFTKDVIAHILKQVL